MTAVFPSPAPPQRKLARFAAALAACPLAVALAVTVLITTVRLTSTVDSDVAWQLWIGQRMLAGADLYRDIIETNPPLWFWMAVPVDRIAALLHVRVECALVVAVGAATGLSLFATNRLISHIKAERRAPLLAYAALALAAMPWAHVGQREQLALIGTLPYVALIASRREGRPVSLILAGLVGIGTAIGFALKHYFLIIPALLEVWLLAGLAKRWRPLRPETIAMVGVGGVYSAALALLEPDFMTKIVPLIRLAYGSFGAPSLKYLFGPFAITGLMLLAFALAQSRQLTDKKAPLASALLIAAVGFALVYFVQFKGWSYHAIPLIGCASLAIAALLAERDKWASSLRIFAPALLTLPLAVSANEQMHPALPSPDVLNAVEGLKPGDPVGFITTETAIPWSVTLQGQYRYASRYNGFWMMQAIVSNERRGSPDARLVELGRQIVSETVQDFECTPPMRIIVFRPRPGETSFDILPFFLREPRFAELLSHYRIRSRTSLETWEIASPLRPPTGPCRHGI